MAVRNLLPQRATLQRTAITKDASGGQVNAYADVAGFTGVPCSRQTAAADVQERYMQREMVVESTVYFGANIRARETDRLLVDGATLLVMGYRDASAGRGVLWAADCVEINP